MIDGNRKPPLRSNLPSIEGVIGHGLPTADQWLNVFREAQMPLWLVDVTRVCEAIDSVRQGGVHDLRAWLETHPEFISRAIGLIRILEMSERAVQLAGARDREDFRRSLDRLVVPESLGSFKDMVLAVAARRSIQDGEATYRTLDGRTVHTWNQVSFLEAEDGSDLLLLAVTDISRLKEAQQRLESSEERYRMLVETARDMIFCHDLEGRITFVNRSALELTGWTGDQLDGMRTDELVAPHLHEELRGRAAQRERGEAGVFLYETAYRTAGGGEIPVEVSSRLIESPPGGSRKPQILVVARDISDRKRDELERSRLEARLRDTQKMESLGVLAGGIAHDFNNFLVAILGSAEMLRSDASLNPEQESQLSSILSAAGSIADLCRQMQIFASGTASEHRAADLSALVRSFSRLVDVSAAGRAAVSLELAADLPPVLVDETAIGQVLIQLVTNAVESLEDAGGVVALRTGSRDLDAADLEQPGLTGELVPGRYVFCEIRDSGCGMAADMIPRICEPFFTTKAVGRGTGLFSSLGILQQHSGGFLFETRPGSGTTVTLLLPARAVKPAAKARGPEAGPTEEIEVAGRTVLVVDDQKEVRDIAESFLRRLGCGVLLAANGFDAVQIFAQRYQEIDFVLLDLGMEGMDGVAVARRLRTVQPTVPLAFVSGFGEEDVRERAAGLEPFGLLSKPFLLGTLREVVARGLIR